MSIYSEYTNRNTANVVFLHFPIQNKSLAKSKLRSTYLVLFWLQVLCPIMQVEDFSYFNFHIGQTEGIFQGLISNRLVTKLSLMC